MGKILLKNIDCLVTMNSKDEIFKGVSLLIEDNIIKALGKGADEEEHNANASVINCEGLIVMPGFVNTHHHLYQTMFRGIKEVQDMPLFPWLQGLYEFWKHLNGETVYYGSLVGFSELLRTGCTTTMDHHYVFPHEAENTLIDRQVEAAERIGIRFHGTRGSMSLGKDQGGLPPSAVIQAIDLNDIAFAGCHDPLVSIVCCGNSSVVKHTIVNGKIIVKDGIIQTISSTNLMKDAHEHAKTLVEIQRKQG